MKSPPGASRMAYKPMAGAPLLGGGDEEDPLGAPGPSAASVSTPGAMGQSARGPFSHAGTSPGPPVLTPTPHESLAAAGEAMVDTDLAHVVLDSSDALLASWRTSATSGVESLHVTRRRVVLQWAHSRLGGLYSERKTAYARLEDVGTIEVTSRPLRWDIVIISAFVIGIITFIVTYVADTDDSPHDKFSGNDRCVRTHSRATRKCTRDRSSTALVRVRTTRRALLRGRGH